MLNKATHAHSHMLCLGEILFGWGVLQVCVDLMLWCNGKVREFYDAGTIGMVSRVTGGRVTCLRGGEPGGRDTESHLREQLTGALRDHAHSASEAILKVGGRVGLLAFVVFCFMVVEGGSIEAFDVHPPRRCESDSTGYHTHGFLSGRDMLPTRESEYATEV